MEIKKVILSKIDRLAKETYQLWDKEEDLEIKQKWMEVREGLLEANRAIVWICTPKKQWHQ